MSPEELHAHAERFKSLHEKDFQQLLEDEANRRPEHTGFIYALSNPAMPGLLKVGKTSGPVEQRARELDKASGVPEPFRIRFIIPIYESLRTAERKAHAALGLYRQSNRREFFKLPANLACHLLEQALAEKAKPPHGNNGNPMRPSR